MSKLDRFRSDKDAYFRAAPDSPIPQSSRPGFQGLSYYPENAALRFEAELEPADQSEIRIQTSDGQERVYRRAATATLPIGGEEVTVTLYDTGHGHGFFLPFRDATSGDETYGAGRYIDVQPARRGKALIDFNLAYNPFCAYNDAYSCPLPPPENWLQVPVRAGERAYPQAQAD